MNSPILILIFSGLLGMLASLTLVAINYRSLAKKRNLINQAISDAEQVFMKEIELVPIDELDQTMPGRELLTLLGNTNSEIFQKKQMFVTIASNGEVSLATDISLYAKALAPLESNAEIFSQIIACRLEAKGLRTQAKEIKLYKELIDKNSITDDKTKFALQDLQAQITGLEDFFKKASDRLNNLSVYRSSIIQITNEMTRLMAGDKTSFTEKQFAFETIQVLSASLVSIEEKNSSLLMQLIKDSSDNIYDLKQSVAFNTKNQLTKRAADGRDSFC